MIHRCAIRALLPVPVVWLVAGCASPRIEADCVYFPPPPAMPRVVHLVSFNRLDELVSTKVSFTDLIRGGPVSPFVDTPAGIAYQSGHLYICDTARAVVHDWDLAGGVARQIGQIPESVLVTPVDVAIGRDETVYVADADRGEVVAFDATGRVSRRFRAPDCETYRPVALAVTGDSLFVADIEAHVIDVFSASAATHQRRFGGVGSDIGRMYFPMGVEVSQGSWVLVSDMLNSRVQGFDFEGRPTLSFGRPGNRYGDMGKPRHLAVGPDGVIFVADAEFAHVHLYDQQARLLMLLGGPADQPGATPMPVGVAIASTLPASLAALVADSCAPKYYLFVTNTVGTKRMSLFAICAEPTPLNGRNREGNSRGQHP